MEPKVDFSKFSRVQDSLKEKLMEKYDEKQQLEDDELDMVAAAGRVPLSGFGRESLDDLMRSAEAEMDDMLRKSMSGTGRFR